MAFIPMLHTRPALSLSTRDLLRNPEPIERMNDASLYLVLDDCKHAPDDPEVRELAAKIRERLKAKSIE